MIVLVLVTFLKFHCFSTYCCRWTIPPFIFPILCNYTSPFTAAVQHFLLKCPLYDVPVNFAEATTSSSFDGILFTTFCSKNDKYLRKLTTTTTTAVRHGNTVQ